MRGSTIIRFSIIWMVLMSCNSQHQDTKDKGQKNSIDNSAFCVEEESEISDSSSTTVDSLTEVEPIIQSREMNEAALKRALVIGIGLYEDGDWSEIHGDLDVPMVKRMLENIGYTEIRMLTNNEATKSAIVSSFRHLSEQCNKRDVVYIHFSGHGQQITDVNGDEDDGWDEAWIPYDAQMAYSESYKGENHLTDDEIGQWLSIIKSKIGDEGKLLVVVDACHSGDSSRDEAGDDVCIRGAKDDFVIPLKVTPKRISKLKEDWLTLTACKDFQVNCEVRTANGNYYGMLSYALCHMAEDMGGIDSKKIMMQLQKFVNKHRSKLPQDVTLTGETDKYSLTDFFK